MKLFEGKRAIPIMLLLLLLLPSTGARAEEGVTPEAKAEEQRKDEERAKKRAELDHAFTDITEHLEPSYVTFTGGYNGSGSMKTGDIFYEAQMYVHYNWYNSTRSSKLCPDKEPKDHIFLLYLPIRFQVRQYRQDSSPVKTPSYNPGIRAYYMKRSWISGPDDFSYFSFGFHHYSNGQSGLARNADGSMNTDTGSFSSEYVEASYYRNLPKVWLKANYRQYLVWDHHLTWEKPQDHNYERALAELTARYDFELQRANPSLQVTAGYKLGRDFIAPRQNASFKDNLQFTTEVFLPVKQWTDIQLYLRWDKGYDYYNISYQKRMNRVQLGIAAKNF